MRIVQFFDKNGTLIANFNRFKSMRYYTTPLILLLFIALTSCSRYQFVGIQGNLPATKTNSFVVESDSLRINYNFNGPHCPVNLRITNKTTTPLYIDWRRSSIIVNNVSYSYYRDNYQFTATTSGVEFNGNINSISNSITTGEASRMADQGFIPPQAEIEFGGITLKDHFFEVKQAPLVNVVDRNGFVYQANQTKFSEADSPMKFRSYLTISYDRNFEKVKTYDHFFWVGTINGTHTPPSSIAGFDNEFYTRKTTGFGNFIGGIAVVAILLVAVAANQ